MQPPSPTATRALDRLRPLAAARGVACWAALVLAAGPAVAQEPTPEAPAPTAPVPAPAGSESDPVPTPVPPAEQPMVDAEAAGRHGTAVTLCEALLAEGASLSIPGRAACGRALVGLGDLLFRIGQPAAARARWRQASQTDVRLLDDASFLKRLMEGKPPEDGSLPDPPVGGPRAPDTAPPPASPTPSATSAPAEPAPPAPLGGPAARQRAAPAPRHPAPRFERRPRSAPGASPEAPGTLRTSVTPEPMDDTPDPDAGPRARRTAGTGLSGGFDGLLAITASTMLFEHLSLEVSTGLLFPTLDVRLRVHGHRSWLTPVVGVGVTIPFERQARFGLSVPAYEDLYALGETFHVDIGVSFAPIKHLDIFAGLAFVSTVDQGSPDAVLFFPQLAVQTMVYF